MRGSRAGRAKGLTYEAHKQGDSAIQQRLSQLFSDLMSKGILHRTRKLTEFFVFTPQPTALARNLALVVSPGPVSADKPVVWIGSCDVSGSSCLPYSRFQQPTARIPPGRPLRHSMKRHFLTNCRWLRRPHCTLRLSRKLPPM